ncbi:uncharacterized protein PFL1_00050 [Pseudozyma flocculosa PF-1]|uniref:Uncharacterized protein n=1 Tax=Pseudozyma flocculosa TaxID=84751 RepID=A0A5C3ETT0_9BASI|nr:uncharacterized protein PFL1_00050 [Pseudozyma flocculosa PF-1]EPQ31851.1 hypothetical protein PFL1_00050 [Pseudozyma flocculosa PF-1]SPO35250.1 uncharacterized protein PSFLO_00721 [Pseudozyma flocculosa]
MAGIYKRSYGHFGGRKDFDTSEIRTTPADELSSWLGDDVCTSCGGPTPHGKLFCSEKCKLADAEQVAQAKHDQVRGLPSPSRTDTFARDDTEHKFRYPCPPSPNLLAQYSTPLKATSLTSPALSAYQSSLPNSRGRYYNRSSNASTEAGHLSMHKKRSSSQSTFSSISESNGSTSAFASTDPSTPSPAYGATEDESSDLDANEFQLPPSVSTASAVMLRRTTRDSPKIKEAQLPSVGMRPSEGSQQKSPMWFARRPSTTNLPPSMWYTSPAITATTKVTATGKGLPAISTSQRGDAQATLTKKAAMDFFANSRKMASPTSPARSGPAPGSVAMRRGHSDQLGARSPPQIQSAASSAGKTMRAISPESSRALSPATGTDASCDRCRTLSSLSGDIDIYAASVLSPSGSRRGSTSSVDNRSLLHKHKHSHSAAAGLFFTQLHAQEQEASSSSPRRTPSGMVASQEQSEPRSAMQRGRSSARVRSSTQRSRSPPRAAARRQASPETSGPASPLPISPRSNPISFGSNPRSAVVVDDDIYHHDEPLRSALPERPSPLALKTHLEAQEPSSPEVRGRGRGRDRGTSTTRAESPKRRQWIHRDCEISWAGYGHSSADRGSSSRSRGPRGRGRAARNDDPGFDDVELELDGDASSDSSEPSSFEHSPRRGRTATRRST